MTAKKQPCIECAAKGRESHLSNCSIGKARSVSARRNQVNRKRTTSVRRKQVPITQTVAAGGVVGGDDTIMQVNRIAIIFDRSGSMSYIHEAAITALNEQLNTIKMEASRTGQPTYISVYDFGSDVHCLFKDQYVHAITEVSTRDIRIAGMTAMRDAIKVATDDLKKLSDANDVNVSFLVMTITDGMENQSRTTREQFIKLMRDLNATDRWTFVFNGPHGSRRNLEVEGVHSGNIQEWEQTERGVEVMTHSINTGMSNYITSRSLGATKTTEFFTVDMSQVSDSDIRNLSNLSSAFKVLKVDNSNGGTEWDIRSFVEYRLDKNITLRRQVGKTYLPGRAYYQLTKPEMVQANKDLVVRDKSTKAIYGGHEARALIGMPTGTAVRVKPGNFGNYDIFIRSTSVNRKLVRGTDLLYSIR